MKKILIILAALMCLSGCGNNTTQSAGYNDHETFEETYYYSEEEARAVLTEQGYHLGKAMETVSEDSYFYYKVEAETEKWEFLTVSGYVDFTAEYSVADACWTYSIKPCIDYDWGLEGSWYAETENYYLYLTVHDFDGSQLHATVEAKYDSTEGGRDSYGKVEQTVTLNMNKTPGVYNVFLGGQLSGKYPVFKFQVEKDSMCAWELYDSYHAEFEKK